MVLFWFVIWLIWDIVGDNEPLTANPVNFWTGALIFCAGLDLARQHAEGVRR